MTNEYDSMTDNDLRRVVAKRLGWQYTFSHGRKNMQGKMKGEKHSRTVPSWPTDANAALQLLQPTFYALWFNGVEWEVQDMTNGKAGEPGYSEYSIPIVTSHKNPARAICIAWLRWQDAQEDSE